MIPFGNSGASHNRVTQVEFSTSITKFDGCSEGATINTKYYMYLCIFSPQNVKFNSPMESETLD